MREAGTTLDGAVVGRPAVPGRTYTLSHFDRPLTTNAERVINFHERAEIVRIWRHAFNMLAREAKVPRLGLVHVTVQPRLKGKRSQDVGACLPAAKAAIDGIVDAGVIEDDTPAHLVALTFLSPILFVPRDEFVLTITEIDPTRPKGDA